MKSLRTKIVVVGDGGCGKTCLLNVFVKGVFPKTYNPTLFETYVADIEVDGKQLELSLWDTAGQEDYDCLQRFSYPDTDVMIICFSIDSEGSLNNVKNKWWKDIKEHCKDAAVVVVGNKKDLRTEKAKDTEDQQEQSVELVTEEQGRAVADLIGAVGYAECSSLKNKGVKEVFQMAAKIALENNKDKKTKCVIL